MTGFCPVRCNHHHTVSVVHSFLNGGSSSLSLMCTMVCRGGEEEDVMSADR